MDNTNESNVLVTYGILGSLWESDRRRQEINYALTAIASLISCKMQKQYRLYEVNKQIILRDGLITKDQKASCVAQLTSANPPSEIMLLAQMILENILSTSQSYHFDNLPEQKLVPMLKEVIDAKFNQTAKVAMDLLLEKQKEFNIHLTSGEIEKECKKYGFQNEFLMALTCFLNEYLLANSREFAAAIKQTQKPKPCK